MAKKQGKVITISLKSLSEGMQVYWDGCPSKVKLWHVLKIRPTIVEVCPLSEKFYPVRAQSPLPDELKTLVVEYEDTQTWGIEGVSKTKQYLPLIYSQWQSAIENGQVDTNKIVEFITIKTTSNPIKGMYGDMVKGIAIAKIISQPEAWGVIHNKAFNEWEKVGGLSNFDSWYVNWLEDNYLPPRKK